MSPDFLRGLATGVGSVTGLLVLAGIIVLIAFGLDDRRRRRVAAAFAGRARKSGAA